MNDQNTRRTADDLGWEAFQYVCGEMTTDEMEVFEARLAEDQSAREAVAEAVELAQSASLALGRKSAVPQTVASTSTHWWYGVPIGIAICLAVVVAIQQVPWSVDQSATSDPEIEPQPPTVTAVDVDLAARWSEVRQLEAESDQSSPDASSNAYSDWLIGEQDRDAFGSTDAPEWMIAAVSATSKEMMDDMDMEQNVDGTLEQ